MDGILGPKTFAATNVADAAKLLQAMQNLGISLEDVDKGLVGTEETFLAMINHLHEMAPYLPEGFEELPPEAKEEIFAIIDYVVTKYRKKEGDENQ